MARTGLFDEKFGTDFIQSVPKNPGIYFFYDLNNCIIYVGKALNLRRRLSQYRNSKRCKAHKKMKTILQAAKKISYTICASEKDALLLENEKIQQLRPRFNISGAYSHLYPLIGYNFDSENRSFSLVYSTVPKNCEEFTLFGVFRSRRLTKIAFDSLILIFENLSHLNQKRNQTTKKKFTYSYQFREVKPQLIEVLSLFLDGESPEFLELVIHELLLKQLSKWKITEIQLAIDKLKLFYDLEATLIKKLRHTLQLSKEFIPQSNRDKLFVQYRFERKSLRL